MIAIYAPPATTAMPRQARQPERRPLRLDRLDDRPVSLSNWSKGCGPATPYQAGFEDSRYNKVYRNPFTLGGDAWRQYDAGHEDARRNKEQRA